MDLSYLLEILLHKALQYKRLVLFTVMYILYTINDI